MHATNNISVPEIKNLVFEGGGVKGIAYGGALKRFDELGLLDNVKRVAGTSSGAITATLLAVGYDPEEISEIIAKTNFMDFADEDEKFFQSLYRFFNKYGWHKGDKLKDWISGLIEAKVGKPDLRFNELRSLSRSNPKLKNLYIIGSNLSDQSSVIYSHQTLPGMAIRDAVRISMSIPFFFQAVINKSQDVLVDGGVIRNYPINLFDRKEFLTDEYDDEPIDFSDDSNYVFNTETIGFRLTDKDSLEKSLKSQKITGLKSFTSALITLMQTMASKIYVHEDDWNRTIAIDTTGVGVADFDLSQDKVNQLIENGSLGVNHYLKNQNLVLTKQGNK